MPESRKCGPPVTNDVTRRYQPVVFQESKARDESKSQVRRDAQLRAEADRLIARVHASKQPLPLAWNEVLKGQNVGGPVLATTFMALNERKEYDSCIEGIEAAIRNDQGQPWMYDVLAEVMSVAGRPQQQIDRVLLSRIDFTDGNEAQMLVTVSMLSKFGAFDQAMKLCREAAKRNPWQPATWTLARGVADRSKVIEDIAWSRFGTLKYVWTPGYETHHVEAQTVLQELHADLLANPKTAADADDIQEGLRKALIRDLRIKVEWAGNADLDLVIKEPNKQTCSYRNQLTGNGGSLIRQSAGGRGRQVEEYVCVEAPPGDYIIQVRNLFGRLITGKVRITVIRHQGSENEQSQAAFHAIGTDTLEIKVPLKSGRGKAQ